MNVKNILTIIFSALLLAGCATYQAGQDFDENAVDKIVTGVTTEAEIIEWFGQPLGRISNDRYKKGYTYTYTKNSPNAASYIPVVGLFAGSSEGEQKSLYIYFDENDVVATHGASSQKH